jgi:uncharacterized protein (TIGR02301 family)
MRFRRPIATIALVLFFSHASLAQLPPYAGEMERLAEVLGSLQFLSELCEDAPAPWRDQMEELLALAGSDDAWRVRLTDRFNLGYSSFAAVYRICTDAARLAIAHYREEGAAITDDIATRFGSGPPVPAPAASSP